MGVEIEYSINDATFNTQPTTFVPLTNMGANIWQGNIIIPASGLDTIYWRFIAYDTSESTTFFGGAAPYLIGYLTPPAPVSAYSFSLTSTFTPPCTAL